VPAAGGARVVVHTQEYPVPASPAATRGHSGRWGLAAHHTYYATPIAATPDGAIQTLCLGCHRRARGR
jgi:hypothetical protein